MKTYFLRTVPDASGTSLSNRERLDTTVRNTGNYFFESAVSRQLADYKTIHSLQELPEDADTLVLSMSNFISPSTDLGWLANLLDEQPVPRVVMIGAGAQAQSFAHPLTLTDGTLRFLSLLSERSDSIGVRGCYTAEILNRFGIKNAEVIGCPSLFYSKERDFQICKPDLHGRAPRTVVHCTPSGHFRDAIGHLLSFAVRECAGYIAQSETELLFDEDEDSNREYFFMYYNDKDYPPQTVKRWMRENVRWFFELDSWFGYMSEMDFSVGARFHGNMAALQVGVPALNLVCDSRTRELCEYLNLPYEFLKDFDGRRSAAQLYDETDFSVFNASFACKYDAYASFLDRNGLSHHLRGKPVDEVDDISASVRRSSAIDLLGSLGDVQVDAAALLRELSLRLERDRSYEVMKLAESGAYDLRDALAPALSRAALGNG
ncbi:polysaccharide pyruvyl transferase family protein [Lysobacter capsici]|uniref:polysaccharide pyruvyl transferase family protein n=1 Tax=Lysobacter capsici TaxID=435897 RepID=UPI0006274ECC|nr:polysaccharide pyruvyl transferase family protein [Lysobacter capsici]